MATILLTKKSKMATNVAQRRFITKDFPVRNGQLVRQPKVGEEKGRLVQICSLPDAINDDHIRMKLAGVEFYTAYVRNVPCGKLSSRPFICSRIGIGMYCTLVTSTSEGNVTSYSSWFDLYASKKEADDLQKRIGTRE